MVADLITTRDAARILGVGPTSIKRWADSGLIECVRTPGGHRRFLRSRIESLLVRDGELVQPSPAEDWLTLLMTAEDTSAVHRRLLAARRELGSWFALCEQLGLVLEEMGDRWAAGKLTILQEHVAVERLHRAVARCCDDLQSDSEAPRVLLVTADGDDHTLGLLLAEVVLREAGWNTQWAGRRTPFAAIRTFVAGGRCKVVAISASRFSRDAEVLRDQSDRLASLCERHRVHLILGGQGNWPSDPDYGHRVRSFRELAEVAAGLDRALPLASE